MENLIDTLQLKIDEARALLSKETREAIDSVNWKLIILEMNKKYNPEQLDDLEIETELLLCGIINPDVYQKEIENRMQITKEEVNLLINQMDRLVFKKIQENLEKILSGVKIETNKNIPENKPIVFDPRFINIPREVQLAIANSNWKENLYKISERYKLNIEQMGIFEELTIKVMSGTILPDNYENELSSKIIIAKEDIFNLVKDVNKEILIPIRELMKKGEENSNGWKKSKQESINNMGEGIPLPPYKVINNYELGIKNEIPINIIEEKLKGATASTNTVSDYTIPKISVITSPSNDPYHEQIE